MQEVARGEKAAGGRGNKAIDYSEESEFKLQSQDLANKMTDESQSQYSNGPRENNPYYTLTVVSSPEVITIH